VEAGQLMKSSKGTPRNRTGRTKEDGRPQPLKKGADRSCSLKSGTGGGRNLRQQTKMERKVERTLVNREMGGGKLNV